MIKKIDANEYGVVKYAITSVDELNRLPKKIAPSSQAILIENGLRVFVYGDGQWVEEVVDGDLSENMRSIVADYERSKIGYDGVKRGSLEERLKDDFQGIYDMLNARDYCEYSDKELKVDNTWMGNQIDTRVEGRTLQNLLSSMTTRPGLSFNNGVYETDPTITVHARLDAMGMIKKNTIYSLVIEFLEIPTNVTRINVFGKNEFGNDYIIQAPETNKKYVLVSTSRTDEEPSALYFGCFTSPPDTLTEPIKFKAVLLEGDHTQTPLSELPYFEGIESVGEIGKNLLDPSELEYGSIVDGAEANNEGYITNRKRSGFIKVKPNTDYVFSSNLEELGTNWWFYDINKKYIAKGGYIRTINTPSNCEYIRIHNGHTDRTPLSNFKLQVEEGTVATEYEPFGYKIKGKSCGKNLLDLKKVKGNTTTSINVIDNNTLEVSTNSGWHGILFDDIELKTGKKYTFTYDCEDGSVTPYMTRKENGVYGTTTHYGGKNPIVITPTNDMTVRVSISSKQAMDRVIIKNIILTESDDISYQPYQESTYSIHSPIPLRSLPSGVCDVYDFESGAVIQRVGKIVLDGSEDWHVTATEEKTIKVQTKLSHKEEFNCKGSTVAISDSFPYMTGSDDIEHFRPDGGVPLGNFIVWINKDRLSSLDSDGFKQWLSQNPMTIYYELFTPIIHYLTPSQLKSFDGTTHVISENTLIPTTTTKILTNTYANVSNVNSTAYSLRRGVNDVAETSAIINETDVEQDDVLDITMCAIDELYSMLEPNLE